MVVKGAQAEFEDCEFSMSVDLGLDEACFKVRLAPLTFLWWFLCSFLGSVHSALRAARIPACSPVLSWHSPWAFLSVLLTTSNVAAASKALFPSSLTPTPNSPQGSGQGSSLQLHKSTLSVQYTAPQKEAAFGEPFKNGVFFANEGACLVLDGVHLTSCLPCTKTPAWVTGILVAGRSLSMQDSRMDMSSARPPAAGASSATDIQLISLTLVSASATQKAGSAFHGGGVSSG